MVTVIFSVSVYLFLSTRKDYSPTLSLESEVFARVGEYEVNSISGWASPFAVITLNSPGLARKTTADERGYFIFNNVPVRKNLDEICFFSTDAYGLATYPVCLAKQENFQGITIRNVLLPPTVLLEKDNFSIGQLTKASGMTFPNSQVLGSHFSGKKTVKTILAKSNENGKFVLFVPIEGASTHRLYLFSILNQDLTNLSDFLGKMRSPKSNTLTFFVYGLKWLIFIPIGILFAAILLYFFRNKKRQTALVKYEPICETKFISGAKILRF